MGRRAGIAWQKSWEVVSMFRVPGPFRTAAVALMFTALVVLSACSQQPGGSPGSISPTPGPFNPSPSATPAATGTTDLTVTVTESPGAEPRLYRLVATGATPDAASTVPDPAAALTALELNGEKIFFPAPAPPQNCTQQYGGPQVATVAGTFKGRKVSASFSMTDGCQITRWQALSPLFGGTAGGTGAV